MFEGGCAGPGALLKPARADSDASTMTVLRALRDRLALGGGSERGLALPTALFALIAAFGLATAAVLASIDAQNGTKNDNERKSAIAAADAGIEVAQSRLNRFQARFEETPCIGPLGESMPETAPGSGWCPPVPVESVGRSTFYYQVSAYRENFPLSVVSVGATNGVSRRVNSGMISFGGENVFADEGLIGQDGIELKGDAELETDIGTNGDIVGKGNYKLCGDGRHGIGKSAPEEEPECEGEFIEGDRELPVISPPADIATNNSNCRLVPDCPNDPELKEVDLWDGTRTATRPWDAPNRIINIENGNLSMGGADYWVCGLFIKGGELIMLANANVRIFVDTPESCGLSDGDTQVQITGNARITSTAYNPEVGSFEVPGIYVLGSPDITTKVELNGNSASTTNELLLYAPYSEVGIKGNSTWIGMIAGKSIVVEGNPRIVADPGIEPPDIPLSSLWQRIRYVECTGGTAPSEAPDASC